MIRGNSLKFKKRWQLFVRSHNETLPIIVVRVSNPDRSPAGVNRWDTAPAPTGFAQIVRDYFPVLSFDWFDFHDHLGVLDAFRLPVPDSGDVGNFFSKSISSAKRFAWKIPAATLAQYRAVSAVTCSPTATGIFESKS
jgi:hypothetical protein